MSSRSAEYRRKKDRLIEQRLTQVREGDNLANHLAAMTLNSRPPIVMIDPSKHQTPTYHDSKPASSAFATSYSSSNPPSTHPHPPQNPPLAFSEALADLDFIREELDNRARPFGGRHRTLAFVRDPPSHPTPAISRSIGDVRGANTGILQLQPSNPLNVEFIRHEDYIFYVISTLQTHYCSTSLPIGDHARGLLTVAYRQWEDLEEHRVKEWNRQRLKPMICTVPSEGTVDTGACMSSSLTNSPTIS